MAVACLLYETAAFMIQASPRDLTCRWSVAAGAGPKSSARALITEEFKELGDALSDWTEEELRTLTREDLQALFPGDRASIGKGLRLIRQLPKPEPKVIYVHEGPEDDAEAAQDAVQYKVCSSADVDGILSTMGASGFRKEQRQIVVRDIDELESGGTYWLHFGRKSVVSLLAEEAKESQGFRRYYAAAWEEKVNLALPQLFAAEGLTLVQQPYKDTQRPLKRQIDGVFADLTKRIAVLVESKSGAGKLSNLSDEELSSASPERLRQLAKENFADAQLLLTARAIQESEGPVRSLGEWPMILVLAPQYMDDLSKLYVDRKRGTFRFIRPDGSRFVLEPE